MRPDYSKLTDMNAVAKTQLTLLADIAEALEKINHTLEECVLYVEPEQDYPRPELVDTRGPGEVVPMPKPKPAPMAEAKAKPAPKAKAKTKPKRKR